MHHFQDGVVADEFNKELSWGIQRQSSMSHPNIHLCVQYSLPVVSDAMDSIDAYGGCSKDMGVMLNIYTHLCKCESHVH